MKNLDINSSKSKMENDFNEVYEPLLKRFMEEIKDVDKENLPIPFIPVHGEKYEKADYKIAFVGWETRNNSDLGEFYRDAGKDPLEALKHFAEVIDTENGYNFTAYGNNFGTGFWDFVMKFLAVFYGISDWEEIKNHKQPDILQSFVWGNFDSIERYEVSAKEKKGSHEGWLKVKEASKIFDKSNPILNVFKPDVVIILMWRDDDNWLTEGMELGKDFEEKTILQNELEYYYIKHTDTHVYWTRHPRSLTSTKIDDIIFEIHNDLKNKKKFEDFPGLGLIEKFNNRQVLIQKLKTQLKEAAQKKGIETIGNEWGNGGETYFKFKLPKTKYETIICFGFDKGFDKFSVGVEIGLKGENYSMLKQLVGSTLTPLFKRDANYTNWAYLHYYDNDLKTWDIDNKIWDGIDDNSTCERLIKIIDDMIKALIGIQL